MVRKSPPLRCTLNDLVPQKHSLRLFQVKVIGLSAFSVRVPVLSGQSQERELTSMQITARGYLTSGIAALGAGAIALSTIQPLPDHVALAPQRAVSTLAVELASAIDPITPWVNTFESAVANIDALVALNLWQPVPLLTTVLKNQATYFQELPDLGLIASQVLGNIQTFFTAPYAPDGNNISDAVVATTTGFLQLPLDQRTVYSLLPVVLGEDLYDQLKPVIDFTTSPVSGELLGLVGPLISPLIQLNDSFAAIGNFIRAGDITGALNELINIPANMTNAALNGGKYLDLTGVVGALGFTLPPEVKSIGLNMGGLLNVVPLDADKNPEKPLSGGVAFDALAADVSVDLGVKVNLKDPGWSVGTLGSIIGLGQALGDAMVVTPPPPPPAVAAVAAAPQAAAGSVEQTGPGSTRDLAEAPGDVADTPTEPPAANRGRSAAGSANSGNERASRASSRGMAKSAGARGAN